MSVKYGESIKLKVIELRRKGYTYPEIQAFLKSNISLSTISVMCNGIEISKTEKLGLKTLTEANQTKARLAASKAKKAQFDTQMRSYRAKNENLKLSSFSIDVKKALLAMLYLGEGAK